MIGIFDSGFGGLTIMKEIVKKLPKYDYMYLGDTLRMPYGGRSQDAIYKFTEEGVDFLFGNECELIILACNTASAKALRMIQKEYLVKKFGINSTKRVLGVIRPVIEKTAEIAENNKVGMIATQSTVDSMAYDAELKKINNKIRLFKIAAPLLVPLIEEGWIDRKETISALKYYLKDLKNKKISTLILGCTHYPVLIEMIKKIMGNNVLIPHQGRIVADSLVKYLRRHPEIEVKLKKRSRRIFYTTDFPEKFDRLGSIFFNKKVNSIKVIL